MILPRLIGGPFDGPRITSSTLEFDLYKLANADNPTGTAPNSDLASIASDGDSDEYVAFEIDTPGTATFPSVSGIEGAYVEWDIQGLNSLEAFMWPEYINKILMYILEDTLPADMYVGVAFTYEGVAANGSGVMFGLQYNASGNEPFHLVNAGSGWGSALSPASLSASTIGLSATLTRATSIGGGEVSENPLHGGADVDPQVNTTRTPQSGNYCADGPLTKVALVCGKTTALGSGGTVTASVRTFVRAFQELSNETRRVGHVFSGCTQATALKVAQVGDSNGDGTTAEAASPDGYGGETVRSGWTYRDRGVNQSVYQAGTSPGAGLVPHWIEAVHAAGGDSGDRYFIRRTASGSSVPWPGTVQAAMEGVIADVNTLGVGGPDVFLVCYGANDAAAGGRELNEYYRNMRHLIDYIAARWPDCWVIIERERTTDSVSYPMDPIIYAAQDALASAYTQVLIADGTLSPQPDLQDAIHWSSGISGGQAAMAARALSLLPE